MKELKSLSTAFGYVLILSILLISCSKSQPASPQDQTKALLAGTWKLQSSTVDGVDQTTLFKNFTINFTPSSFTTTNGEAIWPGSGTWSFQGPGTTTITRNDGALVQIQVTSSSLVMTIDWTLTTLGSGRSQSTAGSNVFTMTK